MCGSCSCLVGHSLGTVNGDRAELDLLVQPGAQGFAPELACDGNQKGESECICEKPRSQQQQSADQDQGPVNQCDGRHLAACCLILDPAQDFYPLAARQPGTSNTGQQDEAESRSDPDHLTGFNQQV